MLRTLIMTVFLALPANAEGERAGDFDYYVLSLSWSPTWCALTGDARNSEQCEASNDFGFVLHGLWPQYEKGWPSYCRTNHRAPSRQLTNAQASVMGTGGAAWHQWKKHGTCSGLSPVDYYSTATDAFSKIIKPSILREVTKPIKLPAKVIESAFLESNQALKSDQITITCKSNRIQEARICLTKDLQPRRCGSDVIRDCTLKDALLAPIR